MRYALPKCHSALINTDLHSSEESPNPKQQQQQQQQQSRL
jgi:hypothetical protein